ncbi:MAG: dihydrofolate reductase [Lachnospiraceae bacterium]|nr:dihydrofolate reductase [Lachnospiraceae bacterium]
MKLIAAVDRHWGIGKNGKLLVQIPEDMKYFRAQTMGSAIVMGRKTLESFPGGRPLSGRTNIVLSTNPAYTVKDAWTVHSLEELEAVLARFDSDNVYIIGGETVYRQLYGKCDLAYITKIDYAYDADAFFPDLDADPDWEFVGESDEETYFDLTYTFCTYRKAPKKEAT